MAGLADLALDVRRWEILALVLCVSLAVWLAQFWLRREPDASPNPVAIVNHCLPASLVYQTTSTSINYLAPLNGDGLPLPTEIAEDVVLEIADVSGDLVFWSLDHPSGDWVLDYAADGLRRKLCFIDKHYFFYNFEEAVWDEVDPQLLDESILGFTDPARYLLAADQLANFEAVSTATPDEPCSPNSCAVWLASSLDSGNEIRIRVNKQTRKTNDVFVSGPEGQLIDVHFYYQPVNLELPTPARWLPDDVDLGIP